MNEFEEKWDLSMTTSKNEYIDTKTDILIDLLSEIQREGYTDINHLVSSINNQIDILKELGREK